jgi:hypothetical protein
MGVIAMLMTAAGAVMIFAIKGTEKIAWIPSLNVHALGWILFLVGVGYGIVASTPHYHRWRNRDD